MTLTQAHNSNNYKTGGTRIYIQRSGDTNYIDLGNIVDFRISNDIQTQEHETSRSGVKKRDRRDVVRQSTTINFTVDEFSPENLKLMYGGGAISSFTQAIASALTTSVTVALGRGFLLPRRKLTSVSVTEGTAARVEGTDYTIDYERGVIFFLTSSTSLIDGDTVTVTYSAPAITTGKQFSIHGANLLVDLTGVIVVQIDNRGNVETLEYSQATIEPSGDVNFSDSDWSSAAFSISVLDSDTDTQTYYIQ